MKNWFKNIDEGWRILIIQLLVMLGFIILISLIDLMGDKFRLIFGMIFITGMIAIVVFNRKRGYEHKRIQKIRKKRK